MATFSRDRIAPASAACSPPLGDSLPVLAIEQVSDHFAPFGIHFAQRLALLGAQVLIVRLPFGFRRAALRTTIRKSRFVGPQLELFPAHYTGFDRKTHRFHFIEAGISNAASNVPFTLKGVTICASQHLEAAVGDGPISI